MSQFDELPEGWIDVELDDVIDGFEAGKSPKSEGRPANVGEVGVLKVSAVSWGKFKPEENKVLLNPPKDLGKESVRKNDLLISRANTVELVGAVVLVKEDYPNLLLSDKTLRLLPTKKILEKEFLLYALRTKKVRNFFEDQATGTSDSMRNLSQAKIRLTKIPLPPLNEQRRIVEKIEALTARIRKARAALDEIPALLDQFRQSVLAAAFRGDLTADWRAQNSDVEPAEVLLERIRTERRDLWEENERRKYLIKSAFPKDKKMKKYKEAVEPDKNKVDAPDSWLAVSADQITFLITDGKHGDCKDELNSGFYFLSVKDLYDGKLNYENARQIEKDDFLEVHFRTNLEAGDILVTNAGTIGRVAIANDPKRTKYTTFQKSVAVLKPLKRFVLSEYLALYVESAVSYLKDKSSGTAVKNLLIGDLKQFTVAFPSLSEQKEIIKRLMNFFAFTEELKADCQDTYLELEQLDRSILAKAFRGELVPQDPNDEPAAVLLDRIRAEREQLGSGKKRGKAKG